MRSQPPWIRAAISRSFGPAGRGVLFGCLWGLLVLVSTLAGITAAPGADVRAVETRLGELVREQALQRNGGRLQADPELSAAAREFRRVAPPPGPVQCHSVSSKPPSPLAMITGMTLAL